MALVPYQPDAHAGFVIGTFADTMMDCAPWCWLSESQRVSARDRYKNVLRRLVRDLQSNTQVAQPRGHDGDPIGWACSIHGALVFAYVKETFRGQGVGRALIEAMKLPPPVPVVYWTPDCSRAAAGGWPGFFDTRALETVTAMAH